MSDETRPSLAELRKPCGPDERITQEAIDILCDIAEAAQALTVTRYGFPVKALARLNDALAKVKP